ncbi:MAG: hypothetical protein V9G24_00485 [Rhodoblastus sp.]
MPRVALARETEGCFETLAEGLPAHERPWSLRAGREAIAARILVLAPLALRQSARSETRAAKQAIRRRGAATFLAGALAGRARARLARLLAHDQHWRIGWRALGPNGGAMAQRAWGEGAWTWLADDRRRFYADPFPFAHEGRLYLFCEEYPYATGKGVISVSALDGAGRADNPRVVLEADRHLSYPVVFRHGGEIWMMPESSAGHRLDLYRAERFPDRWVRDRTLIEGVALSDATPFQADGRWWLTATAAEEGGSSWDCLSLYCSESPLGPWTRCGEGPVLVDASCARPAGHVQSIGGALWRPAQDCVGGYGAGLALCRIDHVGEDGFAQTVAARLRPPDWRAAGRRAYAQPWRRIRIHRRSRAARRTRNVGRVEARHDLAPGSHRWRRGDRADAGRRKRAGNAGLRRAARRPDLRRVHRSVGAGQSGLFRTLPARNADVRH